MCAARGDGVHGRELEQPDRLLDVVVLHDGREGQFRQGFRYTDDGLELTKINDVRRERCVHDEAVTDRMVMGMELRSSLSSSNCFTCFRRETK